MNIIDDFSSYIWCIPLKRKDAAAAALQAWHRLVQTQTGWTLKILVTDNGELLSNQTTDWCASLGIDHLLTAPYTSAHNGRAERIHRTILNKARAMRLACNAPLSLWDEFCRTAAYLTNFTATPTLNNRTPFELWFDRKPSLSHLREIGCRAFALIQTHNPKIYRRSNPCTLIGYAPNAKAYRLWDALSGRVFNSFHVTFVEHLDDLPSDLLPGKLVTLLKDSPSSWKAPGDDALFSSSPDTPRTLDTSPSFTPRIASLPIPLTVHTLMK
jgi:hypothetical protein